ncbi:hypothetical protein JCM10003_380 [Bacteroides pyogenes JCM 10003]|nr:hypothetical protein JCM10003_380 [Bacteroides pyogenes JCM 10003]
MKAEIYPPECLLLFIIQKREYGKANNIILVFACKKIQNPFVFSNKAVILHAVIKGNADIAQLVEQRIRNA